MNIQKQIKKVRLNKGISWKEKKKKIEKIIDTCITKRVLCKSKDYLEYVYFQREIQQMVSSEHLLNHLQKLNIHRPSFKLLAKIITSYSTLAIKKNSIDYSEHALKMYITMRNQYKYDPNTYILNTILNMLCKLKQRKSFWWIVFEEMIYSSITEFDMYTYGTIFEMCIQEENVHKMKLIFDNYYSKKFFNLKGTTQNEEYINELYQKMIKIEEEQFNNYKTWNCS
jgi:hypothetical protein